jgi:hypothetical protein
MPHPKQPSEKVLTFVNQQGELEAKILGWIRGVVASNHELVRAMERLRDSYKSMLDGRPVSDTDTALWRVEIALRNAAKAKYLDSR